jgi:hypothetical protein
MKMERNVVIVFSVTCNWQQNIETEGATFIIGYQLLVDFELVKI